MGRQSESGLPVEPVYGPGQPSGFDRATQHVGRTWTNVSGNLPDAPADSSVIWGGNLVVSTDVGIFATSYSGPGNWVRLGGGQPAAPSVDLAVSPDQGYPAGGHARPRPVEAGSVPGESDYGLWPSLCWPSCTAKLASGRPLKSWDGSQK